MNSRVHGDRIVYKFDGPPVPTRYTLGSYCTGRCRSGEDPVSDKDILGGITWEQYLKELSPGGATPSGHDNTEHPDQIDY